MTSELILPVGWARVALGNIANTQLGKMLNRSLQTGTSTIPYLRNINIRRGSIDLSDLRSMDIAPDERDKFTVAGGDVLITEGGEVGRAAVWTHDKRVIGFQNAIHRVRPLGGISPKFIAYYFEYLVQRGLLDEFVSGVTIKHLVQNKLRRIPIHLPPVAEQHRIVEALEDHLSRLDAGTKSVEMSLRKLEAWVASASLQVFEAEDVIELSTIGKECAVAVGATPSRSNAELWDGTLPWVSSGEVAFNRITSTREHINSEKLKNPDARIHPPGTVMLAMIGEGKTRGQVAILDIEAAHNQNCASIRTDGGRVNSGYLYHFLKARYLVTRSGGSGGVQPALNKAKVQAIELPVVDPVAQRRIVDQVTAIELGAERATVALESLTRRATALRKVLLEAAFTGALVDQDPLDEPASVLIERITTESSNAPPAARRRTSAEAGKAANDG